MSPDHVRPAFPLLLLVFLACVPSGQAARAVALCYHTFLDRPSIDYDSSPSVFSNQILTLRKEGYSFVSLNDILSNRLKGDLNILLTIDDANRSVKTIWPFLRSLSIRPVVFVYPAIVSRMDYALTWEELKSLVREGASVGGHGFNHLYVNQKLYDTDIAAFRREVYLCGDRIAAGLGTRPVIYAYPFGVFSEVTKEHLRTAGYKASFSLRNGDFEIPLSRNADLFDLPRYMVTRSSWSWVHGLLKKRIVRPDR